MHQYVLGATHLESSLTERALGVLEDKLRIVAGRTKKGDPSLLFSTGKATHGMPCPILGSSLQKGYRLEILQQRPMNVFKEVEHLTQEMLGPLSLEKAQGHLIMYLNT